MTLQDLLNADVSSIGEWARQGVSWWLDELSALAPAWLRRGLSARPKHLAEALADGGWRYWVDGRPAADGAAAKRAGGRVGLLLPPEAILARTLAYPRLPLPDLRRMVALDIDRLSPISPDLVHHDLWVISRDEEGSQRVALGLLPRARAERFLEAAAAEGLTPVLVAAAIGEGPTDYRFDFLPAIRRALGLPDERRARRYWWAAAAGLALVNLIVLVGRDMLSVDRLREAIETQRPAVSAVMGVRARVKTQERTRLALIERGERGEPLHVLAALTQLLPPTAWVQRLEWNGQSLRLIGFKSADVDLVALLRASPVFTNPRAASSATPTRGGGSQPFDITVETGKKTHS